jgi:hypothetical protein
MDIKQIVDPKGAKGAGNSARDLHLLQTIQHVNSMPLSDTGSDRGNSPHDSEHSRYSAPRYAQFSGMNGPPADMRYPSPTAMQNSLSMMPQQPSYRSDNGFGVAMQQENMQQARSTTEQTKAFPCSTCGKGFARRSDLARHGMIFSEKLEMD